MKSKKTFESEFSIAVRAYREARGMTQAQLAKRCRVAQATVSEWESPRSHLSERTIAQLARAFGFGSAIEFLIEAKAEIDARKIL